MENRTFWTLLAVWFFVLLGFALGNWSYLINHDEQLRNLSLVAAALMGAPLVAWRMKVAHRDIEIKEFDSRTSSEEVAADSYNRAAELLGARDTEGIPDIQARLSGIFELERLAKRNKEYRHQILRMLTSYVRQQASKTQLQSEKAQVTDVGAKLKKIRPKNKPREDIQAVFHVFSGESASWARGLGVLDFRSCYLFGLYFKPDRLTCSFAGSDLRYATLHGAKFAPKTSFTLCNLSKASLFEAKLRGCFWRKALLADTDLEMADVRDSVSLSEEQLSAAESLDMTLRDAHLSAAQPFPDDDLLYLFDSKKKSSMFQIVGSRLAGIWRAALWPFSRD